MAIEVAGQLGIEDLSEAELPTMAGSMLWLLKSCQIVFPRHKQLELRLVACTAHIAALGDGVCIAKTTDGGEEEGGHARRSGDDVARGAEHHGKSARKTRGGDLLSRGTACGET